MGEPFKLQAGSISNNNQAIWYTESDAQANQIVDVPGTVIIVNETNNFHVYMMQESGALNDITGG